MRSMAIRVYSTAWWAKHFAFPALVALLLLGVVVYSWHRSDAALSHELLKVKPPLSLAGGLVS